MTRDERTIGEAEAERRGYERAVRQAVRLAEDMAREAGEVGAAWVLRLADAIVQMQPEDAP